MIGPSSNLGQVTEGQADFAQGLGRPQRPQAKSLLQRALRAPGSLRVPSCPWWLTPFWIAARSSTTKDTKVHEGRLESTRSVPVPPGPISPTWRRLHTCSAEIRAGQFAVKRPYERR